MAQNAQPRQRKKRPKGRSLGEAERTQVRAVLITERYCDLSPRQTYATLLDEGRYVSNWRTVYCILAVYDQIREGRNQRKHPPHSMPEWLAVEESHSRPCSSNDNRYLESQFNTTNYRPAYAGRSCLKEDVKACAGHFLYWCNHCHYRRGVANLVPDVAHAGLGEAFRQQALEEACAQHPERFVRGMPKVTMPPKQVWINKPPDPYGTREPASSSEVGDGRFQPLDRNGPCEAENAHQLHGSNSQMDIGTYLT